MGHLIMWIFLFLTLSAIAQNETDLKAIQELEKELPETSIQSEHDLQYRNQPARYIHPYKITSMKAILKSGTEYGYVKEGNYLVGLKDNKRIEIAEPFYGKFFRLQDDQGFKYVQSRDGSCIYKIRSESFNSIQEEMALYEPPLKYTPAPLNIIKSDYDKKLHMIPEFVFYLGIVQGSFMRDLFNDDNANQGMTNQYGFNYTTKWKLPVKAGGVINYEKTSYKLRNGGHIYYSSLSFGPMFKTKDFDLNGFALRFQAQIRVSPFARAYGKTSNGNVSFKFNSTDLLLATEHPIENRLGEFVIGAFMANQWLNIKDQPEVVSLRASNETNKTFGLYLSQAFQ